MKEIIITSILPWATCSVVCWSLTAGAQGVHVSTGNTFSIGFNGVDRCEFTEDPFIGAWGAVGFGNDKLGPGESLRLEIFENGLNESPVATQTYSPGTSLNFVSLLSPGSWLDYQGTIRISMLTGAVDVRAADFLVFPSLNRRCFTEVIVPEPSTTVLAALGAGIGAVFWICRGRRRANSCASSESTDRGYSRYGPEPKNTALMSALFPIVASGLVMRMILWPFSFQTR